MELSRQMEESRTIQINTIGDINLCKKTLNEYNQLEELTDQLRSELIQNNIKSIEDKTNLYLETHFDGECP